MEILPEQKAIAQLLMPIDRKRYPKDWHQIARSIKEAAGWRCQHCLRSCLRPGEKPSSLTRSEWTHATLSVHHSNFTPEDNTKENLIALCTPCHLAVHGRTKRSNTSPGQLSLWDIAPNVFAPRQLSLWDTAPDVFGKV